MRIRHRLRAQDAWARVSLHPTRRTLFHAVLRSTVVPVLIHARAGWCQWVPRALTKGARRQPLGRSGMLSAEQLGRAAQDVADIVAYLKTL